MKTTALEPCQRCLSLAFNDKIRAETVMPIPEKAPPRAIVTTAGCTTPASFGTRSGTESMRRLRRKVYFRRTMKISGLPLCLFSMIGYGLSSCYGYAPSVGRGLGVYRGHSLREPETLPS